MKSRFVSAVLSVVTCAGLLAGAAPPVSAVSVGQNFTASTFLSDSNFYPPDSMGAVGPSHFVELINGRYKVWLKSDASLVQSLSLANFWTGAGITLTGGVADDPRVLYDPASARWFASGVDNPSGLNSFLVAVSNSSNPTAGWNAFKIPSDCTSTNLADFPTLGMNRDGIYVAANMFKVSNGAFAGVSVLSVPKSSLLSGSALNAKVQSGVYSLTGFSAQPTVSMNDTALPELLISAASGSAKLSKITAPITNPSILSVATVSVGPTLVPPDAVQKASATLIDTGDGRIAGMAIVQKGVLWAAQAIDNNGLSAIRWYKIDTSSNTLLQTGVIRDASADFYYPSVAANGIGEAVIGFTASSPTQYASSYAAAGSTVGGVTTFGAPLLLKAGTAPYAVVEPGPGGRNRWGDYSATTVDPSDPRRFWTIQEWASDNNVWSTQVTEIVVQFPLPGDANEDGKIDGADLAIWQQNYDPLGGHGDNNTWARGDWNDDNKIDGGDLALWQQNYAPLGYAVTALSVPFTPLDAASPVPEPVTIALLGAALAGLACRRRRR